jgi:AAA family ATP:ADP antiporter
MLLLVTVFLILSGYYLLKPVREGLLLSGGTFGLRGESLKTLATAAMAAVLLVVVPAYGWLASRVSRIRLITTSYLIVLGSLAAFFVLGRAGAPVGLAFYLWLGVVNVFLVGQFWSYATDLCSEEQGQRLLPAIAVGGAAGAIVGPRLALLSDAWTSMIVAGALLAVCLLLFRLVERQGGRGAWNRAGAGAPLAARGGFELIRSHPYLALIAAVVVIANLVNTIGELILAGAAAEHAAAVASDVAGRREAIKAFYGDLFFWVNLAGFAIQAFVASRLIGRLGVGALLFALPLIALGGYGLIGVVGGVALVRAVKIAENGTDYSLQNTVRQALFLPVSREAKYKAKAVIDTFFVRFGDLAAAAVVAVAIGLLDLGPAALAAVNVVLTVAWVAVAVALSRRHRALTA